jgi:hypothetical protein
MKRVLLIMPSLASPKHHRYRSMQALLVLFPSRHTSGLGRLFFRWSTSPTLRRMTFAVCSFRTLATNAVAATRTRSMRVREYLPFTALQDLTRPSHSQLALSQRRVVASDSAMDD